MEGIMRPPDLTTEYLGLNLKNPLVVSSNPLSETISNIRRMEDEFHKSQPDVKFDRSSSTFPSRSTGAAESSSHRN
jgi:hypothetical protein